VNQTGGEIMLEEPLVRGDKEVFYQLRKPDVQQKVVEFLREWFDKPVKVEFLKCCPIIISEFECITHLKIERLVEMFDAIVFIHDKNPKTGCCEIHIIPWKLPDALKEANQDDRS
jgi:hypothetical protein